MPLAIVSLAVIVSVAMTLLSKGPEQKKVASKPMLVTALLIEHEDMTITVPSQGRVSPHTRTTLISEVSGSVIEVSEHFVSGGFVQKGKLLLKLDDRNYRAAVKRAEANVAKSHKDWIQEKGKAQVEILRRLYAEVQQGGDQAFAVFLADKLPALMEIGVEAVRGVDIDRVVVMDGSDGAGVTGALNQRVKGAYGTVEALAGILGLDIEEVLKAANRSAMAASPAQISSGSAGAVGDEAD